MRSANDDLLQMLFGPAVAVIGEQFAEDFRKRNSEEFSAREKENLRKQTGRVTQENSSEAIKEPTRKQRRNLIDWIEDAAETDPEKDAEAAAKWQSILSEILNANDQTTLEALKSLNTYDVRLIHRLGVPYGNANGGAPSKLLNLGILEKRSVFDDLWFLVLLFSGLLLMVPALNSDLVSSFGSIFVPNSIGDRSLTSQEGQVISLERARIYSIGFLIYGMSFVGMSGWYAMRQRKRLYFTELGLDIKRKIDRYLT